MAVRKVRWKGPGKTHRSFMTADRKAREENAKANGPQGSEMEIPEPAKHMKSHAQDRRCL